MEGNCIFVKERESILVVRGVRQKNVVTFPEDTVSKSGYQDGR